LHCSNVCPSLGNRQFFVPKQVLSFLPFLAFAAVSSLPPRSAAPTSAPAVERRDRGAAKSRVTASNRSRSIPGLDFRITIAANQATGVVVHIPPASLQVSARYAIKDHGCADPGNRAPPLLDRVELQALEGSNTLDRLCLRSAIESVGLNHSGTQWLSTQRSLGGQSVSLMHVHCPSSQMPDGH
jgi:hypothetical protein